MSGVRIAVPATNAALDKLPPELFDQICGHLNSTAHTRLARVSKALNSSIQHILYFHAGPIKTITRLRMLIKTLMDTSEDRGGDVVSKKKIKDLRISIDPSSDLEDTITAATLSKVIEIIARLCPSIEIYLTFRNATCTGQPIHSFRNHSFYRVTKLVLNTGQSEPMHRLRRVRGDQAPLRQRPISACSPNKEFWEGLLNGTSLPDLRELEIVHREDPSWYAEVGEIKLDGLKKIEKLKIEHTPELNDNILLRSLAYANSLKRLELIDVESLSYDALAQLIPAALPILTHFTLHVSMDNRSASNARGRLKETSPWEALDPETGIPHLCPLIKAFGRDVQKLDVKLPFLCRDLFLTVVERNKINAAGIDVSVGTRYGTCDEERLDGESILEIVKDHRREYEELKLQQAIKENLKEAAAQGKQKTHGLAEYEEEQRKASRHRLSQKEGWTRTLRTTNRLCRSFETWKELELLVTLEDPSISWTLGNESMDTAVQLTAGGVANKLTYDELFPIRRTQHEYEELEYRRARRREVSNHH